MNLNKILLSLIILFLLFAIFCSVHVGMSWDEPQNHWQGGFRVYAYKTFPLGEFEFKRGGWSEIEPGLYDTISYLISDLLLKIFPGKLIGIKHLTNLIFSFLTLIGLFLISKKIFNDKVAYLSVFFCLVNPFFFGHISINPKDTIVSFALIWFAYATYMYCINYETKRLRYLVLASCFVGFGVGTRLPFIIVPTPIIIAAFAFIISKYFGKLKENKIYKKIFFDSLIFFSITFLIMISAWPYVHTYPEILIEAFTSYHKYPHGPVLDIINGNYYVAADTPRTYFFDFFIFRFPIYILILFSALVVLLKIDNNFFKVKFDNFNKKIAIILSIILFPILIHVISQVKIYNGIRLFLFIIPFISILLAVCFYYILENFKKSIYIKSILSIAVIFFLLFLQRFFYLTPYHYDYSNFTNLKFENTQKLYVHDYWTTSYKELMKLINLNPNLKEIKANFCGGDFFGLKYLAQKHSGKKVSMVPYDQADYIIMIDTVSNDINKKTSCYEIYPGNDIVAVTRLGVKLSVLRKLEK